MEKITSFKINHMTLMPGLYVSRIDNINGFLFTTFDLRFTRPNYEAVMDTASVHTIEHLAATYFRNYLSDSTMYFGPMGCRTGFYLIVSGKKTVKEICGSVINCMNYIVSFSGLIPGASKEECGNYSDMDLNTAKIYALKYLNVLSNI